MKRKTILYLLIILMMIFTFNVKSYAVTLPKLEISTNNYSDGDKITLDEVNKVETGKTLQLYAMFTYGNDLYDPEHPDSMGIYVQSANLSDVIWTSNDTNIALVDSKGLVTGIGEGIATITAQYKEDDETFTATYDIEITNTTKSPVNPGTIDDSNSDSTSDDKTVTNEVLPQTGVNITIISIISIIAIILLVVIIYKKYKNHKTIK